MQKFLATVIALSVAAGMSTAARAADIVYSINQTSTVPEVGGENSPLSDTVLGTITTDGVLGFLAESDILSWDLHLNDNENSALSSHLTPANSGMWNFVGGGLEASPTALSFDFSHAGAVFLIQGKTFGFSSGYQYFCFQASEGPCVQGETIVPYYFGVDGVQATGLAGTVPLSGTPEPAAWAMMLLGFAGLGAVVRSRRRMATASA